MDKKKLTLARFKQYIPLYLMLLPGAVYLFINNYIPMTGIVVAFKTYHCEHGCGYHSGHLYFRCGQQPHEEAVPKFNFTAVFNLHRGGQLHCVRPFEP